VPSLVDTRLFLIAASTGGIKVVSQPLVTRREWNGAGSAIEPYKILKRLMANVQFVQDIEKMGDRFHVQYQRERRLLTRPIVLFRNYGMGLLDCDTLPLSFLRNWSKFAVRFPLFLAVQCLAWLPILAMNRGLVKRFQTGLRDRLRTFRQSRLSG